MANGQQKKEEEKILKNQYFENGKSFLDETKSIFHNHLMSIT